MSALFFVLLFLISASSRAQEVLHFQAANTLLLRDVKNGLHFANFVKHEFKHLKVTPFMSLLVPNKRKCQVWCVKDLKCLSFNLGISPNSDGQLECELLATDMFTSKNVIDSVNYHHYSIKTDCHPMPCRNNGRCQPDYKTNSYSCHCGCPYWGDHCEKVCIEVYTAWSNCSLNLTCPQFEQKRKQIYPISTCPEKTCPNKTGSQGRPCGIGSHAGCDSPVGMEDDRIKDSQITASSYFNNTLAHAPWLGRLHRVANSDAGCWVAGNKSYGEYLQIDLGAVMTITKVATQGRSTHNRYVTAYRLKYSTDSATWKYYQNPACIKTFPGTYNRNSIRTHYLGMPFKARYVRIVVIGWNTGYPSMRAELYGCSVK